MNGHGDEHARLQMRQRGSNVSRACSGRCGAHEMRAEHQDESKRCELRVHLRQLYGPVEEKATHGWSRVRCSLKQIEQHEYPAFICTIQTNMSNPSGPSPQSAEWRSCSHLPSPLIALITVRGCVCTHHSRRLLGLRVRLRAVVAAAAVALPPPLDALDATRPSHAHGRRGR